MAAAGGGAPAAGEPQEAAVAETGRSEAGQSHPRGGQRRRTAVLEWSGATGTGTLKEERLAYLSSFGRRGGPGGATLMPEEAAFLLLRGIVALDAGSAGASAAMQSVSGAGDGVGAQCGANTDASAPASSPSPLALLGEGQPPVPPAVFFAYCHLRDAGWVVHRGPVGASGGHPRAWSLHCFPAKARPRRAVVGTAAAPAPDVVVLVQGWDDALEPPPPPQLEEPALTVMASVDGDGVCTFTEVREWSVAAPLRAAPKRGASPK